MANYLQHMQVEIRQGPAWAIAVECPPRQPSTTSDSD